MTRRRLPRALKAELEAHGASGRIDRSGKHHRLVFEHEGKHRVLTISGTPSDWRASANSRADLRRILKGRR